MNEKFNKEIESIKKNETEIMGLKSSINQRTVSIPESLTNRLGKAEKKNFKT
jgi:hypothetical protein